MRYFIPTLDTTLPPIDEHGLQNAIPEIGNPAGLPATDLEARGYIEITVEAAPVFDPATHYLGDPVNELIAGAWVRHTPVVAWTQPEIDARTLAEFTAVQAAALAAIDAQAEAARTAPGRLTPGSGQAMSYQVKSDEAKACLIDYTAALPPSLGVYPMLDSEVGILANADATITANAYEVAVVVDTTRAAWLIIEATINRVRVQAKTDVTAAASTAAIDIAMAAIVWP